MSVTLPFLKISNFALTFLIALFLFLRYIFPMTIEQTVEVPANRRLFIEVPEEIPAGPVILAFTPAGEEKRKVPVFGCSKGKYRMADDFFEPLEDFKDYM